MLSEKRIRQRKHPWQSHKNQAGNENGRCGEKIKRRIKAANGFENDKTGNYFPCGGMLR